MQKVNVMTQTSIFYKMTQTSIFYNMTQTSIFLMMSFYEITFKW